MNKRYFFIMLFSLWFTFFSYAQASVYDIYIPGFNTSELFSIPHSVTSQPNKYFTVIPYNYAAVVLSSQQQIRQFIHQLKMQDRQKGTAYISRLVELMSQWLANVPYGAVGAEGEGNVCDASFSDNACVHIQQDPIYRTDKLNCTTYVQLVMALIRANTLGDFNHNIIAIDYGADRFMQGLRYPADKIAYFNRNNFVSADFNPVNDSNGRLIDVTGHGVFKNLVKETSALITYHRWFTFQAKPDVIKKNVRVLDARSGPLMDERLQANYGKRFSPRLTYIDYIPKTVLIKKVGNNYESDNHLINQLITPSVIEIIRNSQVWNINGKNISDYIGSGINVSHIGLLYEHHFSYGDTMYQRITCNITNAAPRQSDNMQDGKIQKSNKTCNVKAIACTTKKGCDRVMMSAASNAYPDGYEWSYNAQKHQYYCTPSSAVPNGAHVLSTCNRVVTMPLGNYLAMQQNHQSTFMNDDSLLGIHIEKLL